MPATDNATTCGSRFGVRSLLRCMRPALFLLGGTVTCTTHVSAQAPGPVQIANQTASRVAPTSTVRLQAYNVPSEYVGPVGANLQVQFHKHSQVRVTTDPKTGQLLVMAPDEVHRQIAPQIERFLADAKVAARSNDKGMNVGSYQQQTINLRNLSWRELEDAVTKLAGNKLTLTTERNGELAIFRITNSAGMQDVMQVDRRLNQVNMLGTGPSATGWLQVMHSLDMGQLDNQRATHVVPLAPAEPRRVKRAFQLVNTALPQDTQAQGAVRLGQGEQKGPDDQVTAMGTLDTLNAESGLFGDVQIEFIEEIDLVIVRGSKRDVERTLEVIEKIKAQAVETQPEIEVLPLEHANSQAVEALVTKLYTDIYATRQGPISITALGQPNSLLLIGRREVVDSVISLVRKIDVPLDATNQLKVVRLLHASAVDAEETIRSFFVENPGSEDDVRVGLGTRVKILADFRTNSLILQGAPREIEEVEKLIKEIDVESTTTTNEVRVFPLKNALAAELQEVIQSVIDGTTEGAGGDNQATPPSGKLTIVGDSPIESGILAGVVVTADPNVNALVVRAPTNSMDLISELIKQLDRLPEAEARIKVFHIEHGDATALATLLQQLFSLPVTAGQSTTGGLLGLSPNNAVQGLATGGESSLVQLSITPDNRTNSIIVSGAPSDLEVIEVLLLRLDEDGVITRRTEVVWLRNTNAVDVATALNSFLNNQRQATTQTLLQGGYISAFEQVDREVFIVAEALTNSLVVSATPRYYESMMKVIEKLDRRPPLVAIQVLIAQVSLKDQFDLGTELGLQDALLFDRRSATGGTLSSPGFTVPAGGAVLSGAQVAGQGLGSFALGRSNNALGYGGLVLSAASDSVNVLFRALQDAQRLQVLSRPQIMTMDNRQASVLVGQLVPRVSSTTATQFGNQVSAPDTPVGLQLNVWPRVNQDGLILMPVNITNSKLQSTDTGIPVGFGPNGEVIRSPIIDTTTAQTTISAYSGQTVVFAGLIQKNRASVSRKIPVLGSLPGLGWLFRFESEAEERSELLVVLTPRIIQTDEDYEIYKQVESSRMSWCLSDILNIHGDVGLNGGNGLWGPAKGPVIFPDMQPSIIIDNQMPGESIQEPIIINRDVMEDGYFVPEPSSAPMLQPSDGALMNKAGTMNSNIQPVGYQTMPTNMQPISGGLIENRPLPQGR